MLVSKKNERLGEERYNNSGYLMKIVEYNNANDIVVEFQDEDKIKVHTGYNNFKNGLVRKHNNRLYEERKNNQGCLMKIVEYNNSTDIVVEFQDDNRFKAKTTYDCFLHGCIDNKMLHIGEKNKNYQGCNMKIVSYVTTRDMEIEFEDEYKSIVHAQYDKFLKGQIKNPYYPSVCGVGIVGQKYPITLNHKSTKEYAAWHRMLDRCFDDKTKNKYPAYKDATCSDEWLLFENFYEWLHGQENFDKWYNGKMWAVDKDIIKKGNKIYSSDTCCLVPDNVNKLFIRQNKHHKELPIGVEESRGKFRSAQVPNINTKQMERSKLLGTQEEAFSVYKLHKESLIKQVAQEEFDAGNITNKCYDAMMNYEVEITD